LCITASQIQWTADVTKALATTKERGDKRALKSMKKKQVAMLNKFSEAIRGNLSKIQRLKVVAIVTIEVHARDIIEKLIKSGCNDVTAFEWLSQLRFYWDRVSLRVMFNPFCAEFPKINPLKEIYLILDSVTILVSNCHAFRVHVAVTH
jgi:hypothetical protein